ncbi:MAG: hypothetical protein ACOYO1_13030 [Bacteroidales bacterium]
MKVVTLIQENKRYILTDIFVFLLIYILPAFSHLLAFPLYIFEPMRIVLFTGYLMARNLKNALFLALTIPLFSILTTGHPVLFKGFLISLELFINIGLFSLLHQKTKSGIFIALVVSTVLSKVFYYGFKYLFIQFSLIEGSLVSTDLSIQIVTLLMLSSIFSFIFYKFANK